MIRQGKHGTILFTGQEKDFTLDIKGRLYGWQPDQGENIKRELGHV
jgi:hypothetical protein